MSVIQFTPKTHPEVISVSSIVRSGRQLRAGLISSASENTGRELAQEHDAEPIKSMDDIIRISKYLIDGKRYRDNMLFIVGINFGLRVSDLRMLRFSDLINENSTFKETFAVLEQKTKNTRKRRKNRYITINDAVIEAVTLYLENTPSVRLDDFMFKSESNRGGNLNEPLNRKSIDRILKNINDDLGLGIRMATHSLRKTFGYHQMVMSNNDPRKLLLLQKIYGHSSSAQTLTYIGITGEEIEDAYRKLNLGSIDSNYLINGRMFEEDTATA